MCSVPMQSWPWATASPTARGMTRMASGVSGPDGYGGWYWPVICATRWRTACGLIPSRPRARAATPSPVAIRPSRNCSGPGWSRPSPAGLILGENQGVATVVGERDEPGDRGVDAGPGPGIEGPESQAGSHGVSP